MPSKSLSINFEILLILKQKKSVWSTISFGVCCTWYSGGWYSAIWSSLQRGRLCRNWQKRRYPQLICTQPPIFQFNSDHWQVCAAQIYRVYLIVIWTIGSPHSTTYLITLLLTTSSWDLLMPLYFGLCSVGTQYVWPPSKQTNVTDVGTDKVILDLGCLHFSCNYKIPVCVWQVHIGSEFDIL